MKDKIREWLESSVDSQSCVVYMDRDIDLINDCLEAIGPKWVSVEDKLPDYGQPILLKISGVVQHVTYMRDGGDDYDWLEPFFYDHDDDVKISLKFDGLTKIEWMTLPPTGDE